MADTEMRQRFETFTALYGEVAKNGPNAGEAESLLGLRHWFGTVMVPDPRSGDPLPRTLDEVCDETTVAPGVHPRDQLTRIVDHAGEALLHIFTHLKTSVRLTHELMPIHAARDFDSACVTWLSRKSGRTIREKLAGGNSVMAVRRQMSADTAENRLVKAAAQWLEDLLRQRTAAFPAESGMPAALLDHIPGWLNDDDAAATGRWTNLPPNNTLLQDRNYRKVWDAWLWMQALDAGILSDQQQFPRHWMTLVYWLAARRLRAVPGVRLAAQPCVFDIDDMAIRPAVDADLGVHLGGTDGAASITIMLDRENPGTLALTVGSRTVRLTATPSEVEANQMTLSLNGRAQTAPTTPAGADLAAGRMIRLLLPDAPDPGPNSAAAFTTTTSGAAVVIDLTTLCPAYSLGDRNDILPFGLMMQFWPIPGDNTFPMDVGEASAIMLGKERLTVSILDLLRDGDIPEPAFAEAAEYFTGKMGKFLGGDQLTYMVPDTVDVFSLHHLRRSLNAHFTNASPLPRSVATLFRWLADDQNRPRLREGDCVLVLDTAGEHASLTLLKACAETTGSLCHLLPRSDGLYWDKHPAVNLGQQAADITLACQILQDDGCPAPQQVAALMGLDGVLHYGRQISWHMDDQGWYSASQQVADTSEANVDELEDAVADAVRDLRREGRLTGSVYVLLAGESNIPRPFPLPQGLTPMGEQMQGADLVAGARTLLDWQRQAGSVPLWKEHLPELSMLAVDNGRYDRLELVKQATVVPRRHVPVPIPIDKHFILCVNNKTSYRFPLRQGMGNTALNHQLVLESPAFPLKKDIEVELHLTFTYGDDTPFDLTFHPVGEHPAPFRPIRAQWHPAPPVTPDQAMSPAFPRPQSWGEMARYPGKDNGYKNLLEWLEEEWLKGVSSINSSIVSLTDEQLTEWVHFLRSSLRFPILTMWNQGRSLRDADCPEWFRHFMREQLEHLTDVLNNLSEFADRPGLRALRNELVAVVCCLHGDLDAPLVRHVEECFEAAILSLDTRENDAQPFARALGDGSQEWQQRMLTRVVDTARKCDDTTRNRCLELLAVALWRSEQLLDQISTAQLCVILQSVIKGLTLMATVSFPSPRDLVCYSELLLALVRTRRSEDPIRAAILMPGSEHARRIIPLMERMLESACKKNMNLNSRLSLDMAKPSTHANTPDILYALHEYLLSPPGTDQIVISAVRET